MLRPRSASRLSREPLIFQHNSDLAPRTGIIARVYIQASEGSYDVPKLLFYVQLARGSTSTTITATLNALQSVCMRNFARAGTTPGTLSRDSVMSFSRYQLDFEGLQGDLRALVRARTRFLWRPHRRRANQDIFAQKAVKHITEKRSRYPTC